MNQRTVTSLPGNAAEWDARLRSADCTDAERDAFAAWCRADPRHRQEYDTLQAMLAALRASGEVPEIRALREAALNVAPPVDARRRRLLPFGLAAAAAAVFVIVGVAALRGYLPTDPVQKPVPAYATAIGERSTTRFEDGSVAVLNTNTQLAVDFTGAERRVTLLRGQALFEVAKDPVRPFIVFAGEQRITAIGTVFDVRYEGDAVQVTLVEGVVDVAPAPPAGTHLVAAVRAPEPVRLTAGQQLVTTAIATPTVPQAATADLERATMWQQGRVFFEDAPLSEAVAEMNRYSTVQVVVADASLDAYRVNGMFRTGQQTNFVDALEQYYPLKAVRSGGNRILLEPATED
jgi:transmembrane sensor